MHLFPHTSLDKKRVANWELICLFIALNKGTQIRKNRVCWHGVAKKTKQRKPLKVFLPINQINLLRNQLRVLSPTPDVRSGKKVQTPSRSTRTLSDLNRRVCE